MNTFTMIAMPFLTMIIFGAVGLIADLLITKYANTQNKAWHLIKSMVTY